MIILVILSVTAFVAAGVQVKAGEVGEWGTFTVATVNCSTKVCTVVGDFKGVKYVKANIILGNEAGEDVGDQVAAWYSPSEGRDGAVISSVVPEPGGPIGTAAIVVGAAFTLLRLRGRIDPEGRQAALCGLAVLEAGRLRTWVGRVRYCLGEPCTEGVRGAGGSSRPVLRVVPSGSSPCKGQACLFVSWLPSGASLEACSRSRNGRPAPPPGNGCDAGRQVARDAASQGAWESYERGNGVGAR